MLLSMIRVRVLAFGVLKDVLGADPSEAVLTDGATVADLLIYIASSHPRAILRGIAISVNAEYAPATHSLREGDEVGLLPPVSGGLPQSVHLTREPIDAEALVAAAKHGEDGAVVVFDGIVRNNSRGRQTLHLDYEAYEEMALRQLHEIAGQARDQFGVRHITIVHRLGRLQVGETSVLIVVASAHRAQAYETSRWLIDTLKKTVPIWRKETFVDGAVWADGEPFPPGLGVEAVDAS
jgi:MoaE-MoaD fusion protein